MDTRRRPDDVSQGDGGRRSRALPWAAGAIMLVGLAVVGLRPLAGGGSGVTGAVLGILVFGGGAVLWLSGRRRRGGARRPWAPTGWSLLTRWGLGVLVALGALALAAGAALGGLPLSGPVLLVVGGALSLSLWRWRRGLLPSAVVGLGAALTLGTNAFGLGHPNSAFDFVPALFALVGGSATVAGGIGGLVARTRRAERVPTRRQRRALRTASGALAAALVVSAVLTVVARPTVLLDDGRRATFVLNRSDVFLPRVVQVDGSDGVVLVRNEDDYAHTFTAFDIGLDVYVGPRAERTIDVPQADPGTYRLTCEVTGHEAMTGTLRIR